VEGRRARGGEYGAAAYRTSWRRGGREALDRVRHERDRREEDVDQYEFLILAEYDMWVPLSLRVACNPGWDFNFLVCQTDRRFKIDRD
jgi:hypothetical protein